MLACQAGLPRQRFSAYNPDTEKMKYKELSSNKELVAEAEKAVFSNSKNKVRFFEIDETNIQRIYLSK